MARQSVSPERAWHFGQGFQSFQWTVAQQTDIAVLLGFDDIEGNTGNALTRERSEWYFERIIVWHYVGWAPSSGLNNSRKRWTFARLGQLDDTQDMELTQIAPSMGADLFGRIYQEEWALAYRGVNMTLDGGAISVSTEATATEFGTIWNGAVSKWDINVKSRIQEGASIVLQYGGSEEVFAEVDDTFRIEWAWKALFRRGK